MQDTEERRAAQELTIEELEGLHRDICRRAQSCWDLSVDQARSADQERLSAKGDGYEHAAELLRATITLLSREPEQ